MTTPAPRRNPNKHPKLALFKLERGKGHPDDTGYDQTNTYIIAADCDFAARNIAAQHDYVISGAEIWYNASITTCKMIARGSMFTKPAVICQDYAAG